MKLLLIIIGLFWAAPTLAIDVDSELKLEAAAIKTHPGFAKRSGKRLQIYVDGKLALQGGVKKCPYDDDIDYDCLSHFFKDVVWLYDPKTQTKKPYPYLYSVGWEWDEHSIIIGKNQKIGLSGPPLVSPDGKLIASGVEEIDDYHDAARLRITKWGLLTPAIEFEPSCKPLKWSGNDTLSALCMSYEDNGVETFEGEAEQNKSGKWTLKVTKRLRSTTSDPNAKPSDKTVYEAAPVEKQD